MLDVLHGARTAKRWCVHHWADKISKQVRCCEDSCCRQRTDAQHEKPFHWRKSRISCVQACVAESLKLHRLYGDVSKRRVFGTIISGDWKAKACASCKVYQRPNQIPTPWTIATGKNKAPAIKKPHAPSVKHVNKCCNHAATDTASNTNPQIKLFIFPSFLFLFTAVSHIGKTNWRDHKSQICHQRLYDDASVSRFFWSIATDNVHMWAASAVKSVRASRASLEVTLIRQLCMRSEHALLDTKRRWAPSASPTGLHVVEIKRLDWVISNIGCVGR